MPKTTFKEINLRNKVYHKGLKLKLKYQKILLQAQLKRLKNKMAITKHNQRIEDDLEENLKPGTGSLYLEAKLHFEHLSTIKNQ